MDIDPVRTARGGLAGALAAGVWLAQQPLDKALFGFDYDDGELLGKAVTLGRAWPLVGAALHLGNGALLGAAYANLAPRLALPAWSRGPLVALTEHLLTWPLTAAVERVHPARDELPRLSTSARALAQATWRHLLFGVVLGELERRLNPPPERDEAPPQHVVSSNGHGRLEHVATSG